MCIYIKYYFSAGEGYVEKVTGMKCAYWAKLAPHSFFFLFGLVYKGGARALNPLFHLSALVYRRVDCILYSTPRRDRMKNELVVQFGKFDENPVWRENVIYIERDHNNFSAENSLAVCATRII